MGNQGSQRKSRRPKGTYGTTEEDISEDESNQNKDMDDDLEGTPPAAYDKLIAWMIEMAENDDVDISSPSFVEHITASCAEKHHSAQSVRQQSLEVPNVRQCSIESSGSSRCNSRSSKSREDLLRQKSSLRRAILSRQSTVDYSDGSDIPGEVEARSFDSDADILNPDSILLNNIEETSFMDSSFRPPLRKNQSCTTYQNASITNLLNVNSRKKSKSLMTMRKMLSETRNDEEITPIAEESVLKVLDDDMLDGNIADILYSVEALWPKGSKMPFK